MKLYIRDFLYKVAAVTLFMSSTAFAANPVITSVTSLNGSTVTNLAMLEFKGSNFGALAQPLPLDHSNFRKNINPSTFSLLSTWNENSYMAWTSVVSTGLPGVEGAAYGIWASTDSSAKAFHFRIRNADPYQSLYVYWRKWTSQGSTPNNKFFRIWRNGNGGPNDWVTSTDQGGVNFNESEPNVNGVIGGYQSAYFTTSTWVNQRAIWIRTGSGTGLNSDGSAGPGGTGVWDYMKNGVNWQHRENVDNFQDLLTELVVGDFTDAAHLQPDGTMIQIASLYVSTVANAVFLSTQSTWAAAQYDMQPQPMILRTDTSTIIAVDRVGIDTSKQVYGYVMGTSTTNVNSAGFALNLANSPTQLAPFIVPFVNVSSFSVNWSSAGASYVAVMSTSSDFSVPITSGALVSRTTSYVNLAQHTTFYFKVKVATEADSGYSGGISTATLGTNLAPSLGSASQTSLTASWTNAGSSSYIGVLATDSAFSSIVSSGAVTTPQAFNSLTCNTQYFYEMKVSSETAYDGNMANATTSACSAAASSAHFLIKGSVIITGPWSVK